MQDNNVNPILIAKVYGVLSSFQLFQQPTVLLRWHVILGIYTATAVEVEQFRSLPLVALVRHNQVGMTGYLSSHCKVVFRKCINIIALVCLKINLAQFVYVQWFMMYKIYFPICQIFPQNDRHLQNQGFFLRSLCNSPIYIFVRIFDPIKQV